MNSQGESRPLTDILWEIEAVKQELLVAPGDESARRQDLHDRDDALRVGLRAVGQTKADRLSVEQLKRRIAVIEQRIREHQGLRMSHTSGAQGLGGGGIDPQWLHRWHRAMDRSADLDGMRAELAALRGEMARLEEGAREERS